MQVWFRLRFLIDFDDMLEIWGARRVPLGALGYPLASGIEIRSIFGVILEAKGGILEPNWVLLGS